MTTVVSRLPAVSVITIVRNGMPLIERAIHSVLAQTYPNIEYIIKDGGSTDGTLEVLEGFRAKVAHLESSKDSGISNAWNQALRYATGEYVALLNADDEFEPELIARAVLALGAGSADLAYCDVDLVSEMARTRRVSGHWDPSRLWQGTGFLHPGVVARRSCYERIGGFREDLRYAMDTDWLIRLHLSGGVFVKYNAVCRMSRAGLSDRQWAAARREYLGVLRKNNVSQWQRLLGSLWFVALRIKKGGAA